VGPGHELLKKWDERIGGGRLHPHMEMTGEGLLLEEKWELTPDPSASRIAKKIFEAFQDRG
jgi:hypothetical protein